MDFSKFNKELDKKIEELLQDWRNEVKKTSSALLPLAEKFIESCQGGKRIRGNLVMLGYEIARHLPGVKAHLGGEIIKVAAAYEIMHAAFLAHDDIIDQSPLRRGKKSLYKSVGVSQAITLADLGFFLATRIIAESNFPEKAKNEALKLFSQTMMETAIGQMLDIQKGLPAGRQGDPATIMKLKTARYTVAGPLQLGAILAGANIKLLDNLDKFGINLGIAFQIKDDILDKEALDLKLPEALKYVMQAKKYIPKITSDQDKRKLLKDMADYLVERNK